ncbi:hypothetical protein AC578_4078 [Pseudocercospora eumusae]|uniref:DUF7053 domain-containing protein n=1 Tax=Pseudocercospora eumusae TaxID=321146 RepID=A0A139HDQ2_9PEZI|nr:hypothetical protein AC578_4078 [Pseudocercospora eumusae]
MGKKVQYTSITPLPSNVPRQLAIELLHSHEEVAKLNPLVTGVKSIEAPRDAPNDEYYSEWYEISEVITWGFGLKKKIAFKGVFHNLPMGMQSHTYAPMGVDLRVKYLIGGNQPGEPREPRELGVNTPLDGLYMRQDVQIECNLALASYVKKETKDAIGKMVDRLARKAELLDEGKLHAMFEDGRLKTSKPTDFADSDAASSVGFNPNSPPGSPSPTFMSAAGFGPRLDKKGYGNYHDVVRSSSMSQHRSSTYMPAYQQQGYNGPEQARPGAANMPMINELPGDMQQGLYPQPLKPNGQVFRSELPGDSSFSTGTPSPQPSPRQPAYPPDVEKAQSYQAYQVSPQPNQLHPSQRHSVSASSSAYSESNTPPQHQRQPSGGPSNTVQEWLGSNGANNSRNNSTDANSSHHSSSQNFSRPSSNFLQPDRQRLSLSQPPPHSPRPGPSIPQFAASTMAKCPVCGLFEGDEAAVSHHVSKAHFQ